MATLSVKNLNETKLKGLVLTKALYLRGCDFARSKDEINRMLAIHTFDNSVEMVLKILAEEEKILLSKRGKDWGFYDLLDGIIKDETTKSQMSGLHEQRNRINHHADIPDFETVIKYQGYTEDFLRKMLEERFGTSYNELSLAVLIQDKDLREKIQRAEQFFRNEDYKNVILECNLALSQATFDIADIFFLAGELSGHFGGKEFARMIKDDYAEQYKEKGFYEFAKNVSGVLLQLGQIATVTQFFSDFKTEFLNHQRDIRDIDKIPQEKLREKSRFSLSFVSKLILKWQEEGIFKSYET